MKTITAKTKRTNLQSLVIASLFIGGCTLISCSDEDGDNVKPTITLNAPESGTVVRHGETIPIDLLLEDDVALASCKINIHSNLDHHEHEGEEHTRAVNDSVYFDKTNIINLNGEKAVRITESGITIPDNTKTGDYHLEIYCTDTSTNETRVYTDLVIKSKE